jgi:cytochrome c biogenesis protein CcmG, thiol:disulfide interchange protein DsbE
VNWKRAMIATLAAAPVIALFAFGFTRNPAEIPSPMPGRQAPDFRLTVFAPGEGQRPPNIGDTVHLRGLLGNVLVVNFWASWCGPCRGEHADLTATAMKFANTPTRFFGVLYNDNAAAARRWIDEMGGQAYPGLLDNDSRTAIDYGIYGVPETFVIGPDGRVAFKGLGPVSERQLSRWIDSLLPAAEVAGVGNR